MGNNRSISGLCECSDPGCPCEGHCVEEGIVILYRVDQDDSIGVKFCDICGADALESGLFDDRESDMLDEWIAQEWDEDF